MLAREGEQVGAAAKWFSKTTPPEAIASTLGVTAALSGYGPM